MAYVNTSEAKFNSDGGVYLYLTSPNGYVSGDISTRITKKATTPGDKENEWQRLTLTVKASSTTLCKLYIRYKGFSGAIYADDLQMEAAEAPGNVNLANYGSMEHRLGWTTQFGASEISTEQSRNGTSSLKITGNVESRNATYCEIPINKQGETFVVSGWGRANSVANANGEAGKDGVYRYFGLYVEAYYTDGAVQGWYGGFNPEVTEWQYMSLPVVPNQDKTVDKIRITATYTGNAGTMYVDDVALVRELAQVYTYNNDGNLEKVNSSKTDEQTYTYAGANLKTLTGANGTYEYTYNKDTNNLESAKNDTVTMSLKYDYAGNNLTSTLEGTKSEDGKITSSAAYTGGGNLVSQVTNSEGKTTQYSYGDSNNIHAMTGQPYKVTNPKGVETYNILNSKNGRPIQSYIEGVVSVEQFYENGRLKEIRRGGYRALGSGEKLYQSYFFYYDEFGKVSEIRVGQSQCRQLKGSRRKIAQKHCRIFGYIAN